MASEIEKYTCRFGTLMYNDRCIGEYAHITITFLGELPLSDVEEIWQNLISIVEKEEIVFKIVGEDMFGVDKNIPVWKLMAVGDFENKLHSFHQRYGKPDNGFWSDTISWHISKRNITSDINIGNIIVPIKLDIKQLGSFDPIYNTIINVKVDYDDDDKFNHEMFKELCGGDRIKPRLLKDDFRLNEYPNRHFYLYNTNYDNNIITSIDYFDENEMKFRELESKEEFEYIYQKYIQKYILKR